MTHLFHLWQTLDTEYGPRERVSLCISSLRFVLVGPSASSSFWTLNRLPRHQQGLSICLSTFVMLRNSILSQGRMRMRRSSCLLVFLLSRSKRNTRDPRLHLLFDYDESNVEGWRLKSTKMHTDLDSTIHSPRFRGIRRREHV